MKTRLGVVVLFMACIGLGIALFVIKMTSEDRLKMAGDAILDFSNQLTRATANLDELRQVNLTLTNDLASSRQESLAFSNQFTLATDTLAGVKISLQDAQDQITNLNSHVAEMEAQNQMLDQRAAALTNTIASLSDQIADTQQKLANSETNNTFLERELQRQTTAKAELERRFNDLNQVRDQVKKLRSDRVIARRLQWLREKTDPNLQLKGGQLLVQRVATNAPIRPPAYNLNVEIGADGSVRVIPVPTNTPAASPPP